MFNYTKINQVISPLLIVLLFTLSSCSSDSTSETTIEIPDAESKLITISHEQFEFSEMLLGGLTKKDFYQSIKVNGMFDVSPENKASVSAYFGGYVKQISLLPGQKVNKGQMLFSLENPEYIGVQQKYLEAKGQLDYLKSDYERQQKLADENITSQKTFLKAKSDYKVTLATFESLKKKLTLMNINPEKVTEKNIISTISVRSPISGYITSVKAEKGMFLEAADIAITVTNTDLLQMELNVFEKDLPMIKEGQAIRFHIQNDSKKEYLGSVFLVSKFIDHDSRKAVILGQLNENIDLFAPGMYIEGEVLITVNESFALPLEAVVNVEDDYFVLVKKGADELNFEKKKVEIGKADKGYTEILNHSDFDVNAKFLVKGAFNLIQ